MVVGLIPGPQGFQNGHRPRRVRGLHLDGLKPPLQGRVLADIPAVLLLGGGPHDLELPPAQGGLQNIGGVNGPLGAARTHQGVELVQKEDHVAHLLDFPQNFAQSLLKFAPVLGARHHRGQVQGQQVHIAQGLRHRPGGNGLGQGLRQGGLAHPGLSQQHRVVFGAPAQNFNHPFQLTFPARHRVQPALGGVPGQVPRELIHEPALPDGVAVPGLGSEGGGGGTVPQRGHRLAVELCRVNPRGQQHPGGHTVLFPQQPQQQVLGAYVAAPPAQGLSGGQLNAPAAVRGQPLAGGTAVGPHPHQPGDGGLHQLPLQPGPVENTLAGAAVLPAKGQQQMLGAHIAVAQMGGLLPRPPEGVLGPAGQLLFCHRWSPPGQKPFSPVLPSFPRTKPSGGKTPFLHEKSLEKLNNHSRKFCGNFG